MELRQARLDRGMTQQELVKALSAKGLRGIDGPMISKFESGACLPNRETSEALEDILQISIAEVFASDEEEPAGEATGAEPRISPLSEQLLSRLGVGKQNAKTREALAEDAGVSDRKMRKCIEELRRAGAVILNDQDGCGYYISDNLNEMERQYKQDTARALSILSRRSVLRKILKQAGRPV